MTLEEQRKMLGADGDIMQDCDRIAQKCYVARTILTMGTAYQDARLIRRPDSDWLKG